MTEEKHYMTASEYIKSFSDKNSKIGVLTGDSLLLEKRKIFTDNWEKDFDKHFINKDLLKDKILKILDNHIDRYTTSKIDEFCYELDIKKEILELLK